MAIAMTMAMATATTTITTTMTTRTMEMTMMTMMTVLSTTMMMSMSTTMMTTAMRIKITRAIIITMMAMLQVKAAALKHDTLVNLGNELYVKEEGLSVRYEPRRHKDVGWLQTHHQLIARCRVILQDNYYMIQKR